MAGSTTRVSSHQDWEGEYAATRSAKGEGTCQRFGVGGCGAGRLHASAPLDWVRPHSTHNRRHGLVRSGDSTCFQHWGTGGGEDPSRRRSSTQGVAINCAQSMAEPHVLTGLIAKRAESRAASRLPWQSCLVIAQHTVATKNCESDRPSPRCGAPKPRTVLSAGPDWPHSRGSFWKKIS